MTAPPLSQMSKYIINTSMRLHLQFSVIEPEKKKSSKLI